MDISLNLIDLQYLTNPDQLTKLMQKKDLQQISRNDLDFYKTYLSINKRYVAWREN